MAEEASASPKPIEAIQTSHEEEEETAAEIDTAASVSDHKRQLDDIEDDGKGELKEAEIDFVSNEKNEEIEKENNLKRQRVDGDLDGCKKDVKEEAPPVGNGQHDYTEKNDSSPVETVQKSTENVSQDEFTTSGQHETSGNIEVPNNKVGALIGKAGETIRLLQNNSGARIQITRDAEANPNSSTRPVELTGTLESIKKAEQMIKDVIAEADAGGSPALVARSFGAGQAGSEVYEMQVSNDKAGWIIGKGGVTIKNLQSRSQARIQLIPQHLPEGDPSKERTVQITGTKWQIEAAKSMILDVMNQQRRPSNFSAEQSQQGYRNRGPSPMQSQWGSRGSNPIQSQTQTMNNPYNYPQRSGGSAYPPQNTQQYSQQSYNTGSNYTQQPPPKPAGYDYYGQGTQPPSNNYSQPQAASGGYSYPQTAPPHNYGGYNNQATTQQMYGQQQPSQPGGGFYPQQGMPQTGYAQQQQPQSYGGPSPQQSYPMTQQGPTYPATGYNQPPPNTGYSQPISQVNPGYGQGGYSQPGAVQVSGGYGQYPAQAVPTSNVNANYGYQGGMIEGGGYVAPAPNTGYSQAPAVGYVQQPPTNPVASYDQSAATQVGYGAAPQVGYANKGVSPQPSTGYGGQYDSAPQMYGHH